MTVPPKKERDGRGLAEPANEGAATVRVLPSGSEFLAGGAGNLTRGCGVAMLGRR